MNRKSGLFAVLVVLFSIFSVFRAAWGKNDIRGPIAVWNDVTTPSRLDALGLFIDLWDFKNQIARLDQINAVCAEFPKNFPVVIEAHVIRYGPPHNKITRFNINKAWAGVTSVKMKNPGPRFFDGLIYISTIGTGPAIQDFPGVKIILTPSFQTVKMCGVVHFGVICEFFASGRIQRITVPEQLVKWDADTFDILRVEDAGTAQYGGLIARGKTYETFAFYPACSGRHFIGVNVGKHRDTAELNILPAEMSYLELIPGKGGLSEKSPGMRAMAHYEGECVPPEDVSDQAQWSNKTIEKPKPVKLEVTTPSHPAGRAELCDSVPLQAILASTPGKKLVTARYQHMTASLLVENQEGRSTIDVTNRAGIIWSTGTPIFRAVSPGRFSVTAVDHNSGLSAALSIEVVPPADMPLYPLASVSVPSRMKQGAGTVLMATLFDCSGTKPATGLEWYSLTPDLISCTASGNCVAIQPGIGTVGLLVNGKHILRRSITIESEPNSLISAPSKGEVKSRKPDNTRPVITQKPESENRSPIWRTLDDNAFVESLYQSILDRKPDPSGYRHWLSSMKNGKSRESVLSWFFISPEYKSRKKNNYEFIRDVYQAVYGREPTSSEMTAAIRKLGNGVSRQQWLKNELNTVAQGISADRLDNTKRTGSTNTKTLPDKYHGPWSVDVTYLNPSGNTESRQLWEMHRREIFSRATYEVVGFITSVENNSVFAENPKNKVTIVFNGNHFVANGNLGSRKFKAIGKR